jgi:hypothetical protein
LARTFDLVRFFARSTEHSIGVIKRVFGFAKGVIAG